MLDSNKITADLPYALTHIMKVTKFCKTTGGLLCVF